jgi:hypothetical protein
MPVFIFLHVLTMFVAVAMGYGPAILMIAASRSNDIVALRGVLSAAFRLEKLIGPTFVLGLAFGLVAIFVNDFDPLAGWLIIAYVLFAVAAIFPQVFTSPWLKKVAAAADTSPDDHPSDELRALLTSPRNRVMLALDALIVVALIADMVLKPLPEKLF